MAENDPVRCVVRLPRSVAERLDELTREPGVSKHAIIGQVLNDWLNRKGDDALEFRFAHRLDRISRQLDRIERNTRVEVESLGLFIRYMLAVTPPLAEGDQAGRALAQDRFAAFVQRVGQQLARGKTTLSPDETNEQR